MHSRTAYARASPRLPTPLALERVPSLALKGCATAPCTLKPPCACAPQNMAAYYEKRTVRKRMVKKGFMDESGRTFNIDKKKGAINVVEQEFKKAQKEASTRDQEEQELRRRIQAHRRAILENEQRERMLEDMKADRALGVEVVRMSRAVIQPELNPSVASTMTEESMTSAAGAEEDAEEAADGEVFVGVGMSEEEKKLMGAMGKHVE
jgi:hypothetical protein